MGRVLLLLFKKEKGKRKMVKKDESSEFPFWQTFRFFPKNGEEGRLPQGQLSTGGLRTKIR